MQSIGTIAVSTIAPMAVTAVFGLTGTPAVILRGVLAGIMSYCLTSASKDTTATINNTEPTPNDTAAPTTELEPEPEPKSATKSPPIATITVITKIQSYCRGYIAKQRKKNWQKNEKFSSRLCTI